MNPKATLIRNACKALSPTFRRSFGEIGRTLVNPSAAATTQLVESLAQSTIQLLKAEFSKTKSPVVAPEDTIPEGAHWIIDPLGSRLNALHGRLPISVSIAHVDEKGTCDIGAVFFPIEDVLVLAEKGTGAIGPERLKAAGRASLEDAMLLLPRLNQATIDLGLLNLSIEHKFHPRKSGHSLFDAIDIAAGRADIMVGTNLNRLEVMLATLILTESGAHVTDLKGNKPDGDTTSLVAANLKLHAQFIEVLGAKGYNEF